jgi:DNA-binding NarL/FixJ family response regulator
MTKPSGQPVKCVLLADRHPGFIDGVRHLLESRFDAVLMVADARSLLEGAERLQPALAIVDLSLSRSEGLELLTTLKSRCPDLKLIVLSMHNEPSVVRSALNAGANAYVLKYSIATDLLPAAEAVLAGQSFVSVGTLKPGNGHSHSPK